MTVPAMRTGDVVVAMQRLANSHGNRFLADVQMRQARHHRARVQLIHLLLEEADHLHAAIHAQPLFAAFSRVRHRLLACRFHLPIPDIRASTSNITAKSFFTRPMPRAAVRNSLVTAVVGRGTSSCRPISRANIMSFCIMFTSNQASSGCFSTKGPRY